MIYFPVQLVKRKNLTWIVLCLFLLLSTYQFLQSRSVRLQWTKQEVYLMRFQWLDSVNLYLQTGKLLMLPENIRLEDGSIGEDQGYPLILSTIGKITGQKEMNFGHFTHFNYALYVVLGATTAVLLFLSFKNLIVPVAFYYIYLKSNMYNGGVDHHWMMAAFLPFYLAFLIFLVRRRHNIHPLLLFIYFLIAGVANIIREGDGVVALLLFAAFIAIILIQDGFKKTRLRKKFIIAALLIFTYVMPWLILSSIRTHRNDVYFNGQKSVMITHHGLWHNAFMGLGYLPNPYGIRWDDSSVLPLVRKINPNVNYLTNEYFGILRQLYFKHVFEHPQFFLENLLAKLSATHLYLASLFPQTLSTVPAVVQEYALYLILLGMYLVSRGSKQLMANFSLVIVALVAAMLPGLIAVPTGFYSRGLESAYYITWILLLAAIIFRFKDKLKKIHV